MDLAFSREVNRQGKSKQTIFFYNGVIGKNVNKQRIVYRQDKSCYRSVLTLDGSKVRRVYGVARERYIRMKFRYSYLTYPLPFN